VLTLFQHGFSGADLGFITQRAVKLAIKQAISAEIEAQKERAEGGEGADAEMMEAEGDDPVPELTKAHFEEAMAVARRSVSEVEIRRYEAFAQSMKQSGGMNSFKFPTEEEVSGGAESGFGQAGEDDDLYN